MSFVFIKNDNCFHKRIVAVKINGSKTIENILIDYDKYSFSVKNKAGGVLFDKIFYMYYKDGELQIIKTYVKSGNGEEELINTMKVKKITQELPENALKIPDGCKVYAAGIGDMDDLLDKKVLVEDYGKKGE